MRVNPMSLFYGPARQVGYVVNDIEATMAHWIGLGVGPWFYVEDVGTSEFRYRGKPSAPPKLSIALANSGPLQIELIQQRDDAPSLYRDTLARNGECAQHVAYWTLDHYDAMHARLRETGWTEGHGGRIGTRGRFAYFIRPDMPSAMVELSETTGGKAEHFARIAAMGETWDGFSEPIRRASKPG